MTKQYIGLTLTFALMFTLAGCSLPGSSSSTTISTSISSEADALRNSRPSRPAEINGTIKSVIGNEFTIETIDMSGIVLPEFDRAAMQNMSDTERQALQQQMQDARAKAPRKLVDVTIPVGIPVLVTVGGRGAGGGGFAGGGGRGGQAGTASAGALGASLTTTTRTGSGATAGSGKQGTIADIKEGYTIQVWLMTGSDTRAIAEWVSVSASAAGGAGGFGGGPGGDQGGGAGGARNGG